MAARAEWGALETPAVCVCLSCVSSTTFLGICMLVHCEQPNVFPVT